LDYLQKKKKKKFADLQVQTSVECFFKISITIGSLFAVRWRLKWVYIL